MSCGKVSANFKFGCDTSTYSEFILHKISSDLQKVNKMIYMLRIFSYSNKSTIFELRNRLLNFTFYFIAFSNQRRKPVNSLLNTSEKKLNSDT